MFEVNHVLNLNHHNLNLLCNHYTSNPCPKLYNLNVNFIYYFDNTLFTYKRQRNIPLTYNPKTLYF